jgi:hypothetical protein
MKTGSATRSTTRWVATIGIVLALAACSAGQGPTPTPTSIPTATPIPTSTSSLAPVPTASQIPSPTPVPTLRALTLPGGGPVPIEPGTYVAADPFLLQVTFTVPAGWEGSIPGPNLVSLNKPQGPGALYFQFFSHVYADPCHYKGTGLLAPLPGPSVDALATALSKLPGLKATTPTDVTLGGYQGKQLTLTAPASFAGCTLTPDGAFRIWELPLGADNDLTPAEIDRVWILDVGGQRLVIDAPETPSETAADKAEVQQIMDSVHLAPRS